MSTGDHHPSETQREQARQWFLRRDAGLSAAERGEFEAWLAADPCHDAAYAEAAALWAALEAPARLRAAELGPRPAVRRPFRPLRWAGGALAAACAAFAVWLAAPAITALSQDALADVATARGETRTVTLPDGSRAELGPDTALSWRFDPATRSVILLRGQAFFTVEPTPPPFAVAVREAGTARVLGTRFEVAAEADGMGVVVEEGRVEVSTGTEARVLGAGQSVAVRDGRLGQVLRPDLGAALAWRGGAIVFFREPLGRVVERLERQAAGRIVIARDGLRALRVSGAFPAGDRDGALQAVADTLGVRVVRAGPWLTVLY